MPLDLTGSNLFFVLVLFGAGLFCIMKGGDLFVDAATWIAESTGIPKFIIGATVVSFATTMPELLVSLFSAFEGNADIAVGNAVGSVTANTGLILCISLVCMQCAMTRRQYAGKACLLLSAICLLFVFTRDGSLSLWESAAILAVFAFYMAESLLAGRREQGAEQPAEKPKKDGRTVAWNIGKFVLGAAAIVLGAQLLIDNGSELARRIGVPDAVIAATMIAIGTSLPELVTTIISIRKKQASLSVGNIIGANILDLTLIMPLCALLQGRPQPIERQGIIRPAASRPSRPGASSRRSRPCWTMPRAAWRRSRSIRPISCSSTRRARTSAARAWIRTSRAVLRSSASAVRSSSASPCLT